MEICQDSNPQWFKRVIVVDQMLWFVYSLDKPADFKIVIMNLRRVFTPKGSFLYHTGSLFEKLFLEIRKSLSVPACLLDRYFSNDLTRHNTGSVAYTLPPVPPVPRWFFVNWDLTFLSYFVRLDSRLASCAGFSDLSYRNKTLFQILWNVYIENKFTAVQFPQIEQINQYFKTEIRCMLRSFRR